MAREVAITRDDNGLAVAYGARLFWQSLQHQVAQGTNGFWGRPVAVEHGELGVLQRFEGATLVGGGRASGGARAVEPNTGGLSVAAESMLLGEQIVRETRGL